MSTFAVISTKGGVAKSTLVAHVAVAAKDDRRKALILDGDEEQSSVSVWQAATRQEPSLEVRSITYDTVAGEIEKAQRQGFDFIICDVAAGGGRLAMRIAGLMQHVIVPFTCSFYGITGLRNTVDALSDTADRTDLAHRNALGKAALVATHVPTSRPSSWQSDLEGALAQCGVGHLPFLGMLTSRNAYDATLKKGKGVTEDRRDPIATKEILLIYRNLVGLEKRRQEDERSILASGSGA